MHKLTRVLLFANAGRTLATAQSTTGPMRVAVIGGGVAGCALSHGLREEVAAGRATVTLVEMGRGPGGRAATRTTRDDPRLRVSHGAPAFRVTDERFRALLAALPDGATAPASAPAGALTPANEFVPEAPARERRHGGGGRGTSALCEGLLAASGAVERRFGTMVREIEALPGADGPTWRLVDRDGAEIGRFDWLAVSGSGIAHARWTASFGGEPPLVTAAARLGDAALTAALARVGEVASRPVTSALLAFGGEAAAAWAALPWDKATCEGDATLRCIVVQRLAPDLTAVVLHSTHAFAEERARGVFGATSTAARVGGAASDAGAEARALDELLGAAAARLAPRWLAAAHVDAAAAVYGPHLHRWGNAFPGGRLLPPADAFVPSARVVFLGDYVDSPRAGSVEGAALSGLAAADALRAVAARCDPPPGVPLDEAGR